MFAVSLGAVERLNLALEFDPQRVALAFQRLACGYFHPALADAVFLDIETLFVIQLDADVVFERGCDVMGAAGVGVRHPKWEERPIVAVVKKRGAEVAREVLKDYKLPGL